MKIRSWLENMKWVNKSFSVLSQAISRFGASNPGPQEPVSGIRELKIQKHKIRAILGQHLSGIGEYCQVLSFRIYLFPFSSQKDFPIPDGTTLFAGGLPSSYPTYKKPYTSLISYIVITEEFRLQLVSNISDSS